MIAEEKKVIGKEIKKDAEKKPAEVAKKVEEKVPAKVGEANKAIPEKDKPKTEAKIPSQEKPKEEAKQPEKPKSELPKKEEKPKVDAPKKEEKPKEETPKKEEKPAMLQPEIKSFTSSSANTPISTLMYNVKRNKYDMCHSVQRKMNQWPMKNKSKFLESCLMNIVPQEIIICAIDKNFFVVDGKQRLSCLDEFINKKDTGLTVFGKKYSELDEDTKEKLKSRQINVVTYVNCTDSDIFMLFERYNSGVALSSAQKSRSYCSIALLDKVKELLNKPFIKEKCNLTNGQTLKDEDTVILIQSCILISNFDYKNFSGKEVDRYLFLADEKEIMDVLNIVGENIDFLDSIVKEKNKNLKKIHLPMILACANDSDFFKTRLKMFLTDYDNQVGLKFYCQGSTSKKENVIGRLKFWTDSRGD